MKLQREELKGLMKNKLMAAGLREDHADTTAEILTWSDERGYHSETDQPEVLGRCGGLCDGSFDLLWQDGRTG